MSSQIMNLVARRSSFFLSSLRQSARLLSTPVETPKPAPQQPPAASNEKYNSANHKVNDLERKMLVWTGKYKSGDEVPAYVKQDVMEKTRNRIRIRLANIMMALTVVACIYVVYDGKKAAERGETVQKMNLDWHKEYNDQTRAAAAEARNKSK